MKSSLSSNPAEGSLGLGLPLRPAPLAGLLQLPTAPPTPLVPAHCLPSFPFPPEISFLPGKTLSRPKSLVLQVTRICVEHLMWEGRRQKGECYDMAKDSSYRDNFPTRQA